MLRLEELVRGRWQPVRERQVLKTGTQVDERFHDAKAQWVEDGIIYAMWPHVRRTMRAVPVAVMVGRPS